MQKKMQVLSERYSWQEVIFLKMSRVTWNILHHWGDKSLKKDSRSLLEQCHDIQSLPGCSCLLRN